MSAAQFDHIRVALRVLGGIALALTLHVTADAQAPALSASQPQSSPQTLKEALDKVGCMKNDNLSVVDLFAAFDAGTVPSCFDNEPLSSAVAARSTADPGVITFLSALAYIWGLGPEYIERFSKYNTIIYAPFNAIKYGDVPAAWNNDGTNAGDASVIYVSGFLNFDEVPEQVFTVPPSHNPYYLVAYYDAYANCVGSIGTRTTPSRAPTSYLLVGPKSQYAGKKTALIHGQIPTYGVRHQCQLDPDSHSR